MFGELENQFSLTRAALSTGGRAKSKFLSVVDALLAPPYAQTVNLVIPDQCHTLVGLVDEVSNSHVIENAAVARADTP
ncbi:MAG: hypothetical protein ACLQU3_27945 [Limisphaerales bacterium]